MGYHCERGALMAITDDDIEQVKHLMLDLLESLGEFTINQSRLEDPGEAARFLAAIATLHHVIRQAVPPEVAAHAEELTGPLRTLMRSIKIGPERSGAWKRSG